MQFGRIEYLFDCEGLLLLFNHKYFFAQFAVVFGVRACVGPHRSKSTLMATLVVRLT